MAKSALEVVEYEAAEIRERIDARLREIDDLAGKNRDDERQLGLIDALVKKIKAEQSKKSGSKQPRKSESANGQVPGGLGPSLSVLYYLDSTRNHTTGPNIVDALEKKVKSKAEDKRRVLNQILVHLAKLDEIERKANGRYYLTDIGRQKLEAHKAKSG